MVTPIEIWEIYILDEQGNIIEHTEEDHDLLTFDNEKEAMEAFKKFEEQDISVELWRMGIEE